MQFQRSLASMNVDINREGGTLAMARFCGVRKSGNHFCGGWGFLQYWGQGEFHNRCRWGLRVVTVKRGDWQDSGKGSGGYIILTLTY